MLFKGNVDNKIKRLQINIFIAKIQYYLNSNFIDISELKYYSPRKIYKFLKLAKIIDNSRISKSNLKLVARVLFLIDFEDKSNFNIKKIYKILNNINVFSAFSILLKNIIKSIFEKIIILKNIIKKIICFISYKNLERSSLCIFNE